MRRATLLLVLGTLALSPLAAAGGELCAFKDAEGTWTFSNVALGANCKKRMKLPRQRADVIRLGPSSSREAYKDATNELKAVLLMPDSYKEHVRKAAEFYKLPVELLHAVMVVESAVRSDALSSKGAAGLMQLMPGTAKDMYVRDVWAPEQNIDGGARYLRTLANQYDGDLLLTLAAYNAGPEAVRRAGGVPNIPETREYVRKVLALYERLKARNVKG